ncbi:MAG: DNA alkylation repair protein [Clostridiales bacterium]|nr:DNA alkylation repair protein [Candidatus Scatonaster coprocaballi]
MKQIEEMLFALQDKDYAALTARTAPTLDPATIIGVRVPQVRALAKSLKDDPVVELFLAELPHRYYDENMLHGLLVSEIKDFDTCIDATERFLPYVDNWAVCDIMSPKVFKKNKEKLVPKIREWAASERVYTCRFGLEMLMSHFLDEDFRPEYLEIPAAVQSEEYYVNMMIAWFFATALAKQWDSTIPYLVDGRLGDWVHNKTIQKAIESYRITDEQKTYLRTLKRTGKKDSSK